MQADERGVVSGRGGRVVVILLERGGVGGGKGLGGERLGLGLLGLVGLGLRSGCCRVCRRRLAGSRIGRWLVY